MAPEMSSVEYELSVFNVKIRLELELVQIYTKDGKHKNATMQQHNVFLITILIEMAFKIEVKRFEIN